MAAVERRGSFGPLLQRHRLTAGLSQDELAERAGLSRRGISDLERGERRPLPSTARRLADALELIGDVRADFVGAAQWRTRTTAHDVTRPESNLPVVLSSFVGRHGELAQIQALLQRTRLLTLTGTGGVGKTRLAVEVARGLAAAGGQRVCLVDLAAITDSFEVARATAAALGLADRPERPPVDTLRQSLQHEQLLLILDNCEQVLDGCAELAEVVLGTCPNVRILATSRERLGIAGETAWRVPSLSVPSEGMSLHDIQACEAVQLFVQRAVALDPEFALSEQNAAAVARVCDRLDGIPLAIELAAAQLPALSVQQIAQRVDDALRLLVRGNRTAATRQQTLRAAISWSYALLDPAEQAVFERLSAFAGGWSLEAAEYVCADAEEDRRTGVRVEQADVVDVLVRLVAKSLVVAAPDGKGATRYRLLETLRQYARERLVQRDAADATHNRHADFFLAWARRHLSASDTLQPLAEASIELDNLRAALRWLLDKGEANRALRLGAALRWYWFRQGHLTEGAGWYAEILALAGAEPETEEQAHVLAAAGLIASRQGRAADAEPLYTRALGIWRKLGNDLEVARSLAQLGTLFRHAGRLSEARQCFEEGSTLCAHNCFAVPEGINRIGLAEALYDLERYEEALAQAGRALDIFEATGYPRALSWAKRAIGLVHYQRGAQSAARRFLEDALDEARNVEGPGWWLADALACVAQLDIDARRFDRARTLLREAVDVSMVLGDQGMIARCLDCLAQLAAAEHAHARAIRLAAAADCVRTRAGLPRAPAETRIVKRWLLAAEDALEPAVRDQARRDGAAMSLDRVLTYALDGLSVSCEAPPVVRSSRNHSVPDPSPLSPREREVAVLVARGLTNPRIAAELIIGERTVQTHVGNILAKLGLSSRVQVAAWVAEYYASVATGIDP